MLSVIMGLFDIGGEGRRFDRRRGGSMDGSTRTELGTWSQRRAGGGGRGIFCGERNGATVWTLVHYFILKLCACLITVQCVY